MAHLTRLSCPPVGQMAPLPENPVVTMPSVLLQVWGSEIRGMRLGQLEENERGCRQLQHSSWFQQGHRLPHRTALPRYMTHPRYGSGASYTLVNQLNSYLAHCQIMGACAHILDTRLQKDAEFSSTGKLAMGVGRSPISVILLSLHTPQWQRVRGTGER